MRAWLILFLLIPGLVRAQLTLRGRVTSAETNQPLPFATVFLANTTIGATTAEDGSFILKGVPVGKFDLVASYVGYVPLKLTVETGESKLYRLGLRPDAAQLNEVTVRARRRRSPDWARQVEFFTKYFVGTSQNAALCRLLNPQVLYFEESDSLLLARAGEPLVLENNGLGYRLKFLLREYVYDHRLHRVRFDGDAVFEPLSGTPAEQKRWEENRRRAYYGSAMHFMRALAQRRMAREGFAVIPVKETTDRDGKPRYVGLPGDTLVKASSLLGNFDVAFPTLYEKRLLDPLQTAPDQTVVAFPGLIQVTYTREKEPVDYQKTLPLIEHGYRTRPQSTLLRLNQPSVKVEPSGHFYDPQGITFDGYWSWELMAEELPLDYQPEVGMKNEK